MPNYRVLVFQGNRHTLERNHALSAYILQQVFYDPLLRMSGHTVWHYSKVDLQILALYFQSRPTLLQRSLLMLFLLPLAFDHMVIFFHAIDVEEDFFWVYSPAN